MKTKMRVANRLFLSFCLPFFLPAFLAGATLTEDTVWSGETAVDETLEVPAGITLTIEAGTTVFLKSSVSMMVSGKLLANGTEAEPIRFTRQSGSATWDRIMFIEAEDSLLRNCVIEYSDCEGDHKDYYDDKDSNCNPVTERPPRNYHEAVVVIASHVDIEGCTFRNLPEGDAIAVISDDILNPGEATANIRKCQFLSIGQGVHTRYSYVLVEECYFTGHQGDNDDVDLYGESDPPPLIKNNLMVNPGHDDMINPTRCSAILIGNVIAGSDDHGIVLRDKCSPVVMNNLIYNCSSAGIAVQNQCDALLINNTIVDCGRGVRFFDHTGRWGLPYCLFPGSGKATLINCIIWDCPTPLELANSPYEGDRGSHATVIHCDIEGGQSNSSISSNSTVEWGEGYIDADPLFVDAANGDFHLQAGSPAMDSGTGTYGEAEAPKVDFDGYLRPCGEGFDMGAFEFGDCESLPLGHFRRGDANADGSCDISDPVALLFSLFVTGVDLSCEESADADDSGELDLTDVTNILSYLFLNGLAPPAPGLTCGPDPEDPEPDNLTCGSYPPCPSE